MKTVSNKIISEVRSAGGERRLIAIDGRCGSGKSTLAVMIAQELGAPIIRADDFFLPAAKRTLTRLSEPGGNVEYERILSEVIVPLKNAGGARYRRYDCSTGGFGETIVVPECDTYVIEGSYSCHPELWDYYSLRVFLTVDPAEQMRRIVLREGEAKAEMFRTRWIPMEEKYFGTFRIRERCDLVFDTTDKTDEMRDCYA